LVGFTGCLMVSFLFAEFFHRIRYPRILGYICVGILFGLPVINSVMVPADFTPLLSFLSDVGIVFFLLLAGAEMDVGKLREVSAVAAAVGVLSFITPFALSYAFLAGIGFTTTMAFIVSLCLSVTAAAVAVEILMEYGLLQTREGAVIAGAGMIAELLGVLALTVILALVHVGGPDTKSMLGVLSVSAAEYLIFFLIAYAIGFRVYPYLASRVWRYRSKNQEFMLAVIFGLLITLLSQVFGLSSLIGAFIAGLIINLTVKSKPEGMEIVNNLNALTFGLVIPFFFISIGLKLDVVSVLTGMPLVLALTFIGGFGKYAGVFVAGKLTGLRNASIHTIGLGMNDRGGMELVIAAVALSQGLIDNMLFSIIVSVAFITTFTSLYFFKCQIRENMKRLEPMIDHTLCTDCETHKRLADIK
jgi:Kef-type K+ transport system membrane component KefB